MVAVRVVEFEKFAVTVVPPTVTIAPLTKFVPVIVIVVPPAVLPELGVTEVIVGAGSPVV